ncbi:hypothetical protein CRE_23653 [Caenorhabditis remanei]|uniref:Uncharacterized protein n=1 Tax=Caenorhabditis remanei TaxID=31234 RepID=E3N4A8_CAERE|nr:hypothetical protein CRE_23653 [Caenorhabditis remanei]
MNTNKPLYYPSLKVVLLYMEANKRISLSQRCPLLHKLEKLLPLRIEELKFSDFATIVNNVSYKLGIHQKDRYGPTPAHIEEINQEGGVLGDIDRYGLETNHGSQYVFPGDVVLREQLQHDEEFDVENYLRRLLQIFKKVEENSKKLVDGNVFFNDALLGDTIMTTLTEGLPIENEDVEAIVSSFVLDPKQYMKSIENTNNKLAPYNNRRLGVDAPYFNSIQLTISSAHRVERVVYNARIFQAMNYLNSVLFGGRKSAIFVKNLEITSDQQVLRLPAGLKLKVLNLEYYNSTMSSIGALKAILDKSSFPLNSLTLGGATDEFMDYEKALFGEVKNLILDNDFMERESWTPILQGLNHPRVTLLYENTLEPANDYTDLIQFWMEHKRHIGTWYTFSIIEEETVLRCLNTMKLREEVTEVSERCV